MDERAVDELRRLAERDQELARRAAALRELDGQVSRIGARAGAIEVFLSTYGDEEARRRRQLEGATAELQRRETELADAARLVAEARDEVERALAEHAVTRAQDHIAVAAARLDRARAAAEELERDASAFPNELMELERRAAALEHVRRPSGPLAEWASHGHADLFVAAGQIDAQRERVIREANELASMLLGEPTYGSTPAQALARVEDLTGAEIRKD